MSLKIFKICYLLFFISFLAGSCHDPLIEVKSGDCYFQYEYINHAWGFNHFGFIITPAGEMYTYDKTTPWAFAENGVLPADSLRNNIKSSVRKDTLISNLDLINFQGLASSAISGKMTVIKIRGADMGANICKIIVPDSTNPVKSYREIVLTHIGDTEFHNLAPEASVIAAWLTKMGR